MHKVTYEYQSNAWRTIWENFYDERRWRTITMIMTMNIMMMMMMIIIIIIMIIIIIVIIIIWQILYDESIDDNDDDDWVLSSSSSSLSSRFFSRLFICYTNLTSKSEPSRNQWPYFGVPKERSFVRLTHGSFCFWKLNHKINCILLMLKRISFFW